MKIKDDTIPRHAAVIKKHHRVRTVLVACLVVILFIGAAVTGSAAFIAYRMQGKIQSNALEVAPQHTNKAGGKKEIKPVDVNAGTAIDMLVIGQDTRDGDGKNAQIGGSDPADKDNHQSDTNMIAHVSADRSHVDIVSLPRDSIIDQPACNTGSDIIPARNAVMLNSIFPYVYDKTDDDGIAASCLVNTVNSLTGLDIQQFVLVDFAGLSDMIDAIGGVDVCIPQNLQDDTTGLDLKRGLQHLDGITATQYARVRHGTNTDGSDIMRTVRQQHLIKSLFNQMKSSSTLSNPAKLYNLANAALDHIRISSGLASVGTLAGLVYSLRGIHMDAVKSMTVPTEPYVYDANRVQWNQDSAEVIWDNLKYDKPITTPAGNDSSSQPDTSQPPANNADIDSNTGLIQEEDGRLIDPATGGLVDKDSGTITDAGTGSIIGFADEYVEYTYCKAR